jgi:predicted CopG family antitoxin
MTRLSVDITDDAYKRLVEAANREGVSPAELIRRALNLETYLRENDAKVYVGDADSGELRELEVA